ncbi:hypothetical protein HYC85_030728 [Camellia sinensis]|uniref:Uncharacterized protein n=1 Tax=Camellia sinensis TaxID=4442 RepID=A0A7J7G244_CAMSI|nr:hypothetical protein HYC85_030728 [Camellia sinensis]
MAFAGVTNSSDCEQRVTRVNNGIRRSDEQQGVSCSRSHSTLNPLLLPFPPPDQKKKKKEKENEKENTEEEKKKRKRS